jgi:hypothetical protein
MTALLVGCGSGPAAPRTSAGDAAPPAAAVVVDAGSESVAWCGTASARIEACPEAKRVLDERLSWWREAAELTCAPRDGELGFAASGRPSPPEDSAACVRGWLLTRERHKMCTEAEVVRRMHCPLPVERQPDADEAERLVAAFPWCGEGSPAILSCPAAKRELVTWLVAWDTVAHAVCAGTYGSARTVDGRPAEPDALVECARGWMAHGVENNGCPAAHRVRVDQCPPAGASDGAAATRPRSR